MQPVDDELDHTFRPLFERARNQIATDYPHLIFRTWSSSTGSNTTYKGYDVGVECLFPDANEQEASCVSAFVGVRHITTAPELCDLGVTWCSGQHPDVSVDFLEQAVPYTPASLRDALERVPQLLSVFRQAVAAWVRRGG